MNNIEVPREQPQKGTEGAPTEGLTKGQAKKIETAVQNRVEAVTGNERMLASLAMKVRKEAASDELPPPPPRYERRAA